MFIDIDECTLKINNCNQICTNTIGSFNCSCYNGYELATNSLNNCSKSINTWVYTF